MLVALRLIVQALAQILTGFEVGNALVRHFNLFAGSRIAANTSGSFLY